MADIIRAVQERVDILKSLTLGDVTNSIFKASTDNNERASVEAEMNYALAERLLWSNLKNVAEKRYDFAKENIDRLSSSLGIDAVAVLPGNRQVVHEDNLFIFQKVVKRSATSVDVTKLKIILARDGMDPDKIEKLFAEATVERAPQTIYEVIPKV